MYYPLSKICTRFIQICAAIAMLIFPFLITYATTADASEYGKSVYPPGFRASMSGLVPPAPGTYASSSSYFYTGSASGAAAASVSLGHTGGNATLQADMEVEADTFIEIPSVLWMTPHKVLGGNVGFGAFVPIGWQDITVDVNARATLTLPRLGKTLQRNAQLSISQDTIEFGDPLAMALIGWAEGNWHWNVSGMLNIPIGAYDKTSLTNLGFGHWAFDATGSATWFDPTTGYEASFAGGLTFNGENDDTNYTSGTEFHGEFALMKHFSKAFAVGLTGYQFYQVTGDSGEGAFLGDFEGRVSALGPNINYNFKLGETPVFTSARWLHEFGAENRMEGDAAFLTVTIPFGGGGHQ
jgi:hypothetical protein